MLLSHLMSSHLTSPHLTSPGERSGASGIGTQHLPAHKALRLPTEPWQLLSILPFWVYIFLYCLGSSSLQKQEESKRRERERNGKERNRKGTGRKRREKEKERKRKEMKRKRKKKDANAEWSMVNGAPLTIHHWPLDCPKKSTGKGKGKGKQERRERKKKKGKSGLEAVKSGLGSWSLRCSSGWGRTRLRAAPVSVRGKKATAALAGNSGSEAGEVGSQCLQQPSLA